MKAGQLYIGTSGWHYAHWRDSFYHGVPQAGWLPYYAEHFNAVEINASFYRSQSQRTLCHWYQITPAGFRFSLKGHRYITHTRRLKDIDEAISRERDCYLSLKDKLAVVLWQMPRDFSINLPRLETFCQRLSRWPEARHVIEFRHPSWFVKEVAECLHAYDMAQCLSDAADWPLWDRVTSDLAYLRLHGHSVTYASGYSRQLLEKWRQCILQWLSDKLSVHVYFDNDARAAAPHDAARLKRLLAEK